VLAERIAIKAGDLSGMKKKFLGSLNYLNLSHFQVHIVFG
jgi:hypothetical protein